MAYLNNMYIVYLHTFPFIKSINIIIILKLINWVMASYDYIISVAEVKCHTVLHVHPDGWWS